MENENKYQRIEVPPVIGVVSKAFNRGFVLGKCIGDAGIVTKHDIQAALKEEIESALVLWDK
jgi:hypothetical protein